MRTRSMSICKTFVVISLISIIYLIECNGKESPGKVAPALGKVAPAPGKAAPAPGKAAPAPGKVAPAPGKAAPASGKAAPAPRKAAAAPRKARVVERLCNLPRCYSRCEKKYKDLEIPKDFDNVVGICGENHRCECHLYRNEGYELKFLSFL